MSEFILGAILIFLPGYEDIVNLKERIAAEEKRLTEACRYSLYMLHSNMQVRVVIVHNYVLPYACIV
jgi:HrpA-like RNA helicase